MSSRFCSPSSGEAARRRAAPRRAGRAASRRRGEPHQVARADRCAVGRASPPRNRLPTRSQDLPRSRHRAADRPPVARRVEAPPRLAEWYRSVATTDHPSRSETTHGHQVTRAVFGGLLPEGDVLGVPLRATWSPRATTADCWKRSAVTSPARSTAAQRYRAADRADLDPVGQPTARRPPQRPSPTTAGGRLRRGHPPGSPSRARSRRCRSSSSTMG